MGMLENVGRIMKKNYYTNIILNIITPIYVRINKFVYASVNNLLRSHLYKFHFTRRFAYPRLISIFLTTRCNLRCFICRRENFVGQDLEFENIYKLKNAIKYAKVIDLTGWGEATLYPKFEQVLNYIYSINPRKDLIQLTTNGTRLSDKIARLLNGRLHLLIISLNAATEETYNRDMKNGNFKKTIGNIKSFINALNNDEKNKVSLHFVAHTENFKEIPKFVELAHDLGISDISIGQYIINIKEHSRYSLLNVKNEYNAVIDLAIERGKLLNVKVQAPKFINNLENNSPQQQNSTTCFSPFNECFIEIGGDVKPCCFSGNYSMGNAYINTFESIWFGPQYNKLRKVRYLDACKRCVPFVPFDDLKAHLTENFKQEDDIKNI